MSEDPDPLDGPLSNLGMAAATGKYLAIQLLSIDTYAPDERSIVPSSRPREVQSIPVIFASEGGCEGRHQGCLSLRYRAAGVYGRLHLTPADARRLEAILHALCAGE